LVIDTDTYSARLPHKPLDLTYKEFELLKYLAQHPGWVCTRTQLLDHIWGSDFAAVEYLARARGIRDFVVVAPSRVVLDKTIEQFTPGGPRSIVDRLTIPVQLVTASTFNSPATASAMDDPDTVKVYAFSVQSLIRPDTLQGRRTHRFQEGLGAGFYRRLQDATPLVVFADEHHLYYGPRFSDAVRALNPWALVGLTATPHKKTPADQIIYRYPLAAAIAERYVKTPVIVGRKDDKHDMATKLLDGMVLLDHKRSVADDWAATNDLPKINPVMLVVARNTNEADELAGIIRSDSFRGGRHRDAVLVVHSNAKEAPPTSSEPLLVSDTSS